MKQYCRYCVFCVGNNGIYCEAKGKIMAESTAKSLNKCKDFDFCKIDAFGETDGYKPRNRRVVNYDKRQMSLFEEE